MGEDSLPRKPSGENVFYIENLPGTILRGGAFLYDTRVVAEMMLFRGSPFPAVFRADFLGSMISHLYSAIMIWGSRNINIVKFIF